MNKGSNNRLTHYDFLLSNWLSGATVLSIVLNNHQDITCNGETLPFVDQDPEELICSCSKPIAKCEYYKFSAQGFVLDDAFDEENFSRIPLVFRNPILQKIFFSYYHPVVRDLICNIAPNYKGKVGKFIELHEEFFRRGCEFDGSRIYLDGVKSPRRVELFAQYGSKPIRVLHSIRDGRKFVASYIKSYGLSKKKVKKVAKDWNDYIRMVELLIERYPSIKIMETRHEDLCRYKEGTIKEICDFFDIEYDPDIFVFDGSTYHVLGNNMRGCFDGRIVENNKWKAVYNDYLFDMVTDIQRPYLEKYNYL